MAYKDKTKQKQYQREYQKRYKSLNFRKGLFLKSQKCLCCGKTFLPKNAQQKFCSANCRSRIWSRDNRLEKLYKIGTEEYKIILKAQNNKCAICGKEPTRKNKDGGLYRLHIDHNHLNGKVRGLLCSNCNTALGLLGEDIKILKKAIDYLK